MGSSLQGPFADKRDKVVAWMMGNLRMPLEGELQELDNGRNFGGWVVECDNCGLNGWQPPVIVYSVTGKHVAVLETDMWKGS